ncbi:Transcription factor IIIB 60 kDa subunit [Smittium mucronatum]|uniref:B-related factor 1 n=1 Tax=Smittium mucronatum TaxID=133383 RepID=A0A1R0H4U6_9FUNG|nr:Transcription factor IIIB 60 kDa subunit [Smittium mucronatum]
MRCSGCGGSNIEHDTASGTSFCLKCGLVVEENTIVSELTFAENSAGATVMVGNMVNMGSTRAGGKGVGTYGYNSSSRDNTLYDAKRKIHAVATALKLSPNYVESAQRYYHLSLNSGFTRGRKKMSVAACCLYIVCRLEKSSQMLIDFSDVLQINVFKLGVTFVRLVRCLNLIIPLIDPSLYIYRFASMLDFGDKTQAVALDSLRLVQRMDRDWIQTGRRPAGICGACLLIASRMHNFRRTELDIIPIVKVSAVTLKKRLDEFKKTPASQLSMADFRKVWLEKMADPPSYTLNRLKNKRLTKLVHPDTPDFQDNADLDFDNNSVVEYFIKSMKTKKSPYIDSKSEILEAMYKDSIDDDDDDDKSSSLEKNKTPLDKELVFQILNNERNKYSNLIDGSRNADELDIDVSKWENFDDPEIQNSLLNQDEIEIKTRIWTENNKDYLELQQLKALLKEKSDDTPNKPKPKRRKYNKTELKQGDTALESTKNMLVSKKLSKKINYDVLDTLFEIDVSPLKPQLSKKKHHDDVSSESKLAQLNKDLNVKPLEILQETSIAENDLSQSETQTQTQTDTKALILNETEGKDKTLLQADGIDGIEDPFEDDVITQVDTIGELIPAKDLATNGDYDEEEEEEEEEEEVTKEEVEFASSARFALGYDDDDDYGDDYEEYD